MALIFLCFAEIKILNPYRSGQGLDLKPVLPFPEFNIVHLNFLPTNSGNFLHFFKIVYNYCNLAFFGIAVDFYNAFIRHFRV